MTKTLYIIRHAKSSWNFELPDHDRPLGLRGRRDVKKIGKYLSNKQPTPGMIISSTASRAFYTALFIADEWGFPEEDIIITKDLFHSGVDGMMDILSKSIGDSVAIVGHNPGLTSLCNRLTDEYLDNLPTCGVMGISFKMDQWQDIRKTKGSKIFSAFPKKI